jgi:hypothetical protein
MDRQNSGGAELLWADFCSCAYEVSNSGTAGGLYLFNRYFNRQYSIESPLPEPLGEKLSLILQGCLVYYMPFVQNPEGFLHDVRHTLLWDERGGGYAAAVKHGGDGPEGRMFVWLRLKPDGYVFVSLLSVSETSEESKKWHIIRAPSGVAGEMFLSRNPNSREALAAFPAFLAKHKGMYDYLYVNSLGIYRDIVSPPPRLPIEETGTREAAMGFLYANDGRVFILVKEPAGDGWVSVSFTGKTAAAKFRAKLSAAGKNFWGVRWKQIDIPYGAMIYLDKGIVFYKVVKLRKPRGEKAGYMFEFRLNGGKAYIRFPHIFRSSKKLIDFVERANTFKYKKWMREGGGR